MKLMKLEYHLSWTNFVTALTSHIEWFQSILLFIVCYCYHLHHLSLSHAYIMITPVIVIQIIYIDISSHQYHIWRDPVYSRHELQEVCNSGWLLLSFRCNVHSR